MQNNDRPYPAPARSSLWGDSPAPGGLHPQTRQGAEPSPLPPGKMALGVTPCPGGCLLYDVKTATADGIEERNDILKAAGGKCDTALEAAEVYLQRYPNQVVASFPFF